MKRALAAALVALTIAAPAAASWRDERLDRVASVFAMRPVQVACYARGEPGDPWPAGGYVKRKLAKARVAHLREDFCRAALDLNGPADLVTRAVAVTILVHEAYHLRRWGGAASEPQVECKAIRHWRVGARLLGASEETIRLLWPAALADHYQLTEWFDLRTFTFPYEGPCNVPPLTDYDGSS